MRQFTSLRQITPPGLFSPMEPLPSAKVIAKEGWFHQIKWDGIRALCYLDGPSLQIFTKNGRERNTVYPELAALPCQSSASQAVFDGEIIVLSEQDKPSFELVLMRERLASPQKIRRYASAHPVKYVVFDILAVNGRPLTGRTLLERQQILGETLTPNADVGISDNFANGQELFDLMKKKGWEGIVSKNPASVYSPGKHHRDWFKTKLLQTLPAVVGGLQMKNSFPNALLLGIFDGHGLRYIGKASLGLKQADFRLLNEHLPRLEIAQSPFYNFGQISPGHSSKDGRGTLRNKWLRPLLTCRVNFLEWTKEGSLRHPQIAGFTDLPAENPRRKE